jgi:hypothetical protein
MAELSIVPECYVDTKVAEIVGQARKYNHQHGCGDVANQLKNRLKDNPALGIIDEDKNKGPVPKYFSEFEEIKHENDLILKKHKEKKQYLILVCPEIENWLQKNASTVKLNLPANLFDLKQITKRQDIDSNIEFYRFIKDLIKKEAPGIMTLKNWIESFNKNELPLKQ